MKLYPDRPIETQLREAENIVWEKAVNQITPPMIPFVNALLEWVEAKALITKLDCYANANPQEEIGKARGLAQVAAKLRSLLGPPNKEG